MREVLAAHGTRLTDRQVRSVIRAGKVSEQELGMMVAIEGITLGELRATLRELESHDLATRRRP
jgi:hypothetical protein